MDDPGDLADRVGGFGCGDRRQRMAGGAEIGVCRGLGLAGIIHAGNPLKAGWRAEFDRE